jgi:hypothetical protein
VTHNSESASGTSSLLILRATGKSMHSRLTLSMVDRIRAGKHQACGLGQGSRASIAGILRTHPGAESVMEPSCPSAGRFCGILNPGGARGCELRASRTGGYVLKRRPSLRVANSAENSRCLCLRRMATGDLEEGDSVPPKGQFVASLGISLPPCARRSGFWKRNASSILCMAPRPALACIALAWVQSHAKPRWCFRPKALV